MTDTLRNRVTLESILADILTINSMQGLVYKGTVSGIAGAPNFQCAGLAGYSNDYFEGYWAYVVWDSGGGGGAPQGQQLVCTGYVSATGDFTVAAFAPALTVGDKVLLIHPSVAKLLSYEAAITGSVVDGAPTIIDFNTSIVEVTNNHFNGGLLMFLNGPNIGQTHLVDVYTGAGGNVAFAINDRWTDVPVNGDSFVLIPNAGTYLKKIFTAIAGLDPWTTLVPDAYGVGSAGKILGTNLNAAISSRAVPGDAMTLTAAYNAAKTAAQAGDAMALLAAAVTAIRESVCLVGDPASSIGKLLYDAGASVGNILLDTQVRRVASGTSGVIAGGANKYIGLDSGTNGAEILAVIINGVIGADWTLDIFVPTDDAVAAPAAGDKRDAFSYVLADTKGGLLGPFAIAYNAFLKFTNDSAGNQTISDVVVMYRSRGTITISAWI